VHHQAVPGQQESHFVGRREGQAITGGSSRTGFKPTDWFEARMEIGTNVELGYFNCSVLTNVQPVE